MRALAFLLVLGLRAAALEVVAFPAAPLGADGDHLIEIYVVDGEALVPGTPMVRAQHGSVSEVRAAPDGGWLLRYHAAKGPDQLLVTTRRGTAKVDLAVEPAGRVQLAMTLSPSPLLLEKGAHAEVRISVRDAAGRPGRAPLRLGA